MLESESKPDTEERYSGATQARNLRVEADRGGAADFMISAGWNTNRIGMALLRLHSQWDSEVNPARKAFKAKSDEAYTDMLKRLAALHELPVVRSQLRRKALSWGVPTDEVDAMVPAVIQYWLSQVCKSCNGVTDGCQKVCKICSGTCANQTPFGSDGRRLANFMDSCVASARVGMGRRLRP